VAGFRIREDVRLILITGAAGSGKSTLARRLYCGLPESWRMVALDDYFGLVRALRGEMPFWTAVRRHMWIPATAVRYYTRRGARLLIEGIVPTDDDARMLCAAARLKPEDPADRILRLHSSEEETVRRKQAMSLVESRARDHGRLHERLERIIRLNGAVRIETEGRAPGAVLREALRHINADPPDRSSDPRTTGARTTLGRARGGSSTGRGARGRNRARPAA
jgi:energy-coupling factor transporter ATP-binding protein EcfA2